MVPLNPEKAKVPGYSISNLQTKIYSILLTHLTQER